MESTEKNSISEKRQTGAGLSPDLQKNILTTVAYYDAMDYPMTAFEVWKYLMKISSAAEEQLSAGRQVSNEIENNCQCTLPDVINGLEDRNIKRFIEEYRGFYFLKGRRDLVEQRIERNKISEDKYKIIIAATKCLRLVPYIRMIGVAGKLAMKNAKPESDLDLLIFIKKKKIFTGRFFATLLVHLIGRRRHGNKIKNRICLNHYLSENYFVGMKDIFSAHEYSFLTPVYNFRAFEEFQKKNGWVKRYMPNFSSSFPNLKLIRDNRFTLIVRRSLEFVLFPFFIEKLFKNWQLAKIKRNPQTKKTGGVIISTDEELAFWPNFENQGPKIFEKFQERIAGLK